MTGYECKISLESFQDFKVGDVLEAFTLEPVIRGLDNRQPEATLPLSA
jgi:hypothetical protein